MSEHGDRGRPVSYENDTHLIYCPYCDRKLPRGFEHPKVDTSNSRYEHIEQERYRMSEAQQRFYTCLAASIEDYEGFVQLPPRQEWDYWWAIFHLCRAHHALNPDRGPLDGWLKVVDQQREYMFSVPDGFEVEGLTSYSTVRLTLKNRVGKIKAQAEKARKEYGSFEVRRVQGRIFIRHTGPIPVIGTAEEVAEQYEKHVKKAKHSGRRKKEQP